MRYRRVPDETIRRLPKYLRALLLLMDRGQKTVSSVALADLMGGNPGRVRKDFSYFGGFGKRGFGYDVETLAGEIRKILRLNVVNKAALVGVGNLGRAILAFPSLKKYGFEIVAAFDNDPKKIGEKAGGIVIEHISQICDLEQRGVYVGIIAVPRQAAQQTADDLLEAGVRGIVKFSQGYITVPKRVKVITIDIAMDFARLPYYMPRSPSRAAAFRRTGSL
ncbi:MAG: redox-sensing transcriptional repressor Rex [Sedimentisphaerales bacterium]|nr:redox-sensing transcriptional repressor Rex [Sedimentisphaerales bacterium]